jgi:hypothetical protein
VRIIAIKKGKKWTLVWKSNINPYNKKGMANMISFKEAIKEWEAPLGEMMIGYSALTRKACTDSSKIFVIVYWNEDKESNDYKSFDVGLNKVKGRWMVDRVKFQAAVTEKINAAEDSNRIGKTKIKIIYPDWAKHMVAYQEY